MAPFPHSRVRRKNGVERSDTMPSICESDWRRCGRPARAATAPMEPTGIVRNTAWQHAGIANKKIATSWDSQFEFTTKDFRSAPAWQVPRPR